MATPQESITTVNGRQCTRSRARTAATPTLSSVVTEAPPALISSTPTVNVVQQVATSVVAEPPPPSPSPTRAAPPANAGPVEPAPAEESAVDEPTADEAPAADPQQQETDPAPTNAVNAAPSVAVPTAPVANLAASPSPSVAPGSAAIVSGTEASGRPAITSPLPPASNRPATTLRISSGVNNVPTTTTSAPSTASEQATDTAQSSLEAISDSSQQSTQPNGAPVPTPVDNPSGGSSGMIGPDPDASDGEGLTISASNTNVGGIVGGVLGGFTVVVLISVLLFLCLRRRRSREPFAKWQKRVSDEKEERPALFAKLEVVPAGLKAIRAGVQGFYRKTKRTEDINPIPYNRQSARSSISSVYSVRPNRRSQSMSEAPSRFRQQIRDFGGKFGDRMPSLKRSRTLLQKKQDTMAVGVQSPFPRIVDDPVIRNSKGIDNPFADPEPLDPPRTLLVLNPDPNSREATPKLQPEFDGLRDQQRGPISPKAAALSTRGSRDPFASILDELEEKKGMSTPDWLRDTAHKRTQSATTALRSHPPSTYTASIYTTAESPFWDPSEAPPVPTQPLPPNPPRRPVNAYTAGLPSFNATSSSSSRESTGSLYFGEPGPSRPTTNMFSEVSAVSAVPRVGRQSDPFDLDRPEVLGFGHVGGRQVRASVTRQNSKSKRLSTVPNWLNVNDGQYERTSAVPGPLRNPSAKK
jgi:hypothetical protein